MALEFLQTLIGEFRAYGSTANVIPCIMLVHDQSVDPKMLEADVKSALGQNEIDVRILNAPDIPYYEKKGLAALRSDADIAIFADSDCRYVDGWFSMLIDPIVAGEADVTYGSTRALDAENYVERVSTFAWFFPSNDPKDPLHAKAKSRFFANNFAVRSKVIGDVPIPRLAASRSHGGVWVKRLRATEYRMLQVNEAVAHHKQYDTFGELMGRAVKLGRDKDFGVAFAGAGRGKRILRSITALFELIVKFFQRLFGSARRTYGFFGMLSIALPGLVFQLVAWACQFWSALSRTHRSETEGYSDAISNSTLTAVSLD